MAALGSAYLGSAAFLGACLSERACLCVGLWFVRPWPPWTRFACITLLALVKRCTAVVVFPCRWIPSCSIKIQIVFARVLSNNVHQRRASPGPWPLTLYPRRGFERAPGPPRGAFRPPSCLAPLAPRGQPGLIRTGRGSFIGLPVGRKARGLVFDDFGPATCRPSKSSRKAFSNAKH